MSVIQVLEDEEFRHFHKIRNSFNDYQVTKLIEIAPYSPISPRYKDQLGRIWTEETIGVQYHTHKWSLNPYKILADEGQTLRKWGKDKKNRFSRKFLMNANLPGCQGAAYEMIVHRSGSRISGGEYMETFNFGLSTARSSFSGRLGSLQLVDPGTHYKLDIAPHNRFGHSDYKCVSSRFKVQIVDMVDLFESGDLDLKSLFQR